MRARLRSSGGFGNSAASLVRVNGVALGVAAIRESPDDRLALVLSAGSAVACTAIDVIYVVRRTIRPVYLGDALVQMALLDGLALSKR